MAKKLNGWLKIAGLCTAIVAGVLLPFYFKDIKPLNGRVYAVEAEQRAAAAARVERDKALDATLKDIKTELREIRNLLMKGEN